MDERLNKNLLTLFWLISLSRLFSIFFIPLADTTESRYGNTAYIMAKTGDWITPYFDYGVAFWGKPPLSFWFQALSYHIFGIYDFAARIPSLLLTLATAWLIYKLVIFITNKTTALLAIVIYSSMSLVYVLSGVILTDIYLTFATTLSLISFIMVIKNNAKYWNYLFFVGLAIGLLAKGPITLIIVGGIITLWILLLFKSRIKKLKLLPWFKGVALMLIITLPWYIIAELKTPGFLNYFIIGEHFNRFVNPGWKGDLYGSAHKKFHGFIWLTWIYASLPWGLIAIFLFVKNFIYKKISLLDSLKNEYTSFLIVWALFIMLFFTMAGNILWTYILPSLPPLAIILADYFYKKSKNSLNKKFITSSSLFIPFLSIIATIFIIIKPIAIPSEKFLIEKYNSEKLDNTTLYFVAKQSFSTKYYYGEKIKEISYAEFNNISNNDNTKYFFIIRNNAISNIKDISKYKKLYTSKKYFLYSSK